MASKQTREIHVAFDGTEHADALHADEYERLHVFEYVSSRTAEQIEAAVASRADPALADLLEDIGKECMAKRLAMGIRRRQVNRANGEAVAPAPAGPPLEGDADGDNGGD